MRIAIVNDMPMAVEALRRTIAKSPECLLCWIARDGKEAVQRCREDLPDLILMDLIMPVMNGVEATRIIMQETPCAILVVTATVDSNADKVFEAMGHGALDATSTPVFKDDGALTGDDILLHKVDLIGRLLGHDHTSISLPSGRNPLNFNSQPPMVAIGASTGGPHALAAILSQLPFPLGASVVIIQHVDVDFAEGMVEWLHKQSTLPVLSAREGAPPLIDHVQVAVTRDHLVLSPEFTFHYTPDPLDCPFRPSVDAFFASLRDCCSTPGVAALLTGMGADGAHGLLLLKQTGWYTMAQDETSSVIFGMPRAAIEMGAAADVLPVSRMAEVIQYKIANPLTSRASANRRQPDD